MKLNRAQWIKFRAEQLALRAQREEFLEMYATRAHYFGFAAYDAANQAFREFLQPYIDEARKAYAAETQAHYENGWVGKSQKPVYGKASPSMIECDECGIEFEADNEFDADGKQVTTCADCEDISGDVNDEDDC